MRGPRVEEGSFPVLDLNDSVAGPKVDEVGRRLKEAKDELAVIEAAVSCRDLSPREKACTSEAVACRLCRYGEEVKEPS